MLYKGLRNMSLLKRVMAAREAGLTSLEFFWSVIPVRTVCCAEKCS